jgi:hypothetical protein
VLVTSQTRNAATQLVKNSDIITTEPINDIATQMLLKRNLGDKFTGNDGIAELAAALD